MAHFDQRTPVNGRCGGAMRDSTVVKALGISGILSKAMRKSRQFLLPFRNATLNVVNQNCVKANQINSLEIYQKSIH